jgi:hypothetical protein
MRRMRFACWITKATEIPLEYVILIAFPRQQMLRERASMSPYTQITCFVTIFHVTLLLLLYRERSFYCKYVTQPYLV